MSETSWGKLTEIFSPDSGNPHLDDNRLVAAPALLERLPKTGRGLDFGCGTGWLAAELVDRGFQMEGVEREPELIAVARRRFSEKLTLHLGGLDQLTDQPVFDFIVSMMVLQFLTDLEIEDFGRVARTLVQPEGTLAFAVHSPDYLRFAFTCDAIPSMRDFWGWTTLSLGEDQIPIFVRGAEDYNRLLSKSGWTQTHASTVPFNEAFLSRHPEAEPPDAPDKFLVMGFKRS